MTEQFFIKEKENFFNNEESNQKSFTCEKEDKIYDIKSFDKNEFEEMQQEALSIKDHQSYYSNHAKEESIVLKTTPITIQKYNFADELIFIKELNNRDFILGFEHNLKIYDYKFQQKEHKIIENSTIYNICVREQNEGIIICSENGAQLITFNNKGDYIPNNKKIEKTSFACAEISNNNHIICHDNEVVHYTDFFDITNEEINSEKITDISFRGVIGINENIVAIISNKNLSNGNGEDKLLFYNRIPKSIIGEIIGYSFIHSNGLTLISNVKKNYKILLCSCKNSLTEKENFELGKERSEHFGILYIYINEDNIEFNEQFIDTEDFEVYCFCQLFENSNKILDNKNEENETDYILVGGLDHDKNQGIVKIYKVEDEFNKIVNTKIIINDNIFKELNAPINNIIQTKNTRKIIIGSSNGFIYLFDTPEIKDISDEKFKQKYALNENKINN